MMTFDRIYRQNAWNGVESRSGPGSGTSATTQIAQDIVALIAELEVQSVLDVGCGDGFWMPHLPRYVGYDWSREAVKLARANHPDRNYVWAFPKARWFDLVMTRDATQHLSLAEGAALLDAMRGVGTWLLASTYVGGENVDIATGDFYCPDLTAAPFHLGQPERLIFDGYGYSDPQERRDPRKFLGLWQL